MKKGDLRRGQILDTAEKLFFEQGYDRTSVQEIGGGSREGGLPAGAEGHGRELGRSSTRAGAPSPPASRSGRQSIS